VENAEQGGSWLPGHPAYLAWREGAAASLLWLEGKPGSGKSLLSKLIVRQLEEEENKQSAKRSESWYKSVEGGKEVWTFSNPRDESTITARFYYSFRGGHTQTSHELMLRSIVYQIWRRNSRLFPLLRHRYRQLKSGSGDADKGISLWDYSELKSALLSLHQISFDLRIFIVIDGIDESVGHHREDVLKFLPCLAVPDKKCVIKMLIASRPENDISSWMARSSHHIKLQDENQSDIKMIVDSRIDQMIEDHCCPPGDFSVIKDYIVKHSSGVFLWVTLVLKDLLQLVIEGGYSREELLGKVKALPEELGGKDGFYRIMIDSLVKKHRDCDRGRRVFAWVAFAERPLSFTELRDVLAVPITSGRTNLPLYSLENWRPHQLDRGIQSICGGLVEVSSTFPSSIRQHSQLSRSLQTRGQDDFKIVQLIHQTAREFLLDQHRFAEPYHLDATQGDLEITITCCRYIRIVFMAGIPQMEVDETCSQAGMLLEHLSGYELLPYALSNLGAHCDHLGSHGTKVHAEFENFVADIGKRGTSYASLLLEQWIEAQRWRAKPGTDARKAPRMFPRPLRSSIWDFLESGRDSRLLSVFLALRTDLLHMALLDDRFLLVDPLLRHGADPNSKVVGGQTSLHLAAGQGHTGLAEILLDYGADPNSKDAGGQAPLHLAARHGHFELARQLLRHRADPDSKDAGGQTPLHSALKNGHKLLENILI